MNKQFLFLITGLMFCKNMHASQLSQSQAKEQQNDLDTALDFSFGDIDESEQQELSPAAQQMELEQAMIDAANRGDLQAVEKYIAAGVNVNAQNIFGEDTALMNVAMKGHLPVVKFLIKAGANPNLQDRLGQTALIKASVMGKSAIVNELLAAKADFDIRDQGGYTALLHAAMKGYADIVKSLHTYGADLNVRRTGTADTPLLLAAGYNKPKVVKFLLEAGANPHLANAEGKTVFTIAQNPRASTLKKVLDNFMAIQTQPHRQALQDVAEKAMAARWKMQVPEEIAAHVQEMLRPTPEEVVD